jgi:glutamate/tyrosine decarboxylase-like PLP-dependent enzyme
MSDERNDQWDADGVATPNAKQWARFRSERIRRAFPSYFDEAGRDPFAELVGKAIAALGNMRHDKDGPAFLGSDPSGPHYGEVTRARLADKMASVDDVLGDLLRLFEGLPSWNHPLAMPNVVPPPNIAAAVAAMMTSVFSPNIIEGDYSWNVSVSELESAAMVADLVGWNPDVAGGLYTYGGSGCYLYGIKYALTHVLGVESRRTGIREDVKILASQQGHYCKLNSSDWTGLGMDNVIGIETDAETNAMSLEHLEQTLADLQRAGTPVAAVVCTMGTTDAFAMDPVRDVRALLERYPNPEGYGSAMIYCDAVIGWSWLTFKTYDWDANPLELGDDVLALAKRNCDAMQQALHADALGCDFHKSGWAPYNCSLFAVRDLGHFKELMMRPGSEYLHERTWYNPGLYTLEVSRSGAYSMAGWATLKYFGYEGFQAILGGILETSRILRRILAVEGDEIVCVNDADHGFVTLFRVYPRGTNADEQYERELTDPECKADLVANNQLQARIADKLWEWFRDGQRHAGAYAPYISHSSGYRTTEYDPEGADRDAVVYALKSFPMNLNITEASMKTVVQLVLAARDEVVDVESVPPTRTVGPPPYDTHPKPMK